VSRTSGSARRRSFPASPRARAIAAILLGGASVLHAAAAEVLARWRGGELTGAVFAERHDPDGEARRAGGDRLRNAIVKAAFLEIYLPRAFELGLDRDPEVQAEHDAWRRRVLARSYRERFGPPDEVAESEARSCYEEHRRELFTTGGEADLTILFVRCLSDAEGCRDRMAALRRRIAGGEAPAAVAADERARSGEANGVFPATPLGRLTPELRAAALAAPLGELSPVVETPIGLFCLEVSRRVEPRTQPYDLVAPQVLGLVRQRRFESWRRAEIDRLRRVSGSSADDEELFAAAARAAGLDREPLFLAHADASRRWTLADHAFYRDERVVPSNAELDRRLAADPESADRHRRYDLLLALIPAADEPYRAIAAAREIASELERAEDPAAVLRRLPATRPEVRRIELAGRRRSDLYALQPGLASLARSLGTGAWRGPMRFAAGGDGDLGWPESVGFVLLEASRLPPAAEIRGELLRAFRSDLGSVAAFTAFFGPLLDFELVADESPP
jgi:PPIC-type PPIASE domain